jgi:hypothetical protein
MASPRVRPDMRQMMLPLHPLRLPTQMVRWCGRLVFLPQEERIIARQQESDIFRSRELNFAIKVKGDSWCKGGGGRGEYVQRQ